MTQDIKAVALELARLLRAGFHGQHTILDRAASLIEALLAHIAELEAQLVAVGAGGVEPLRKCLHQIAEPAHPTQQGLDAPTEAARSVLAERARQISAEGWTPEADDNYNPGVLALHGGLYACHAFDNLTKKRAPEGWQWDEKWWKSKDPRSNLVKAGALILAEIERIDRVCAAQAKQVEQA